VKVLDVFLGKRGFFGNNFLTGSGDVGEMGESQHGPQRFKTEVKRIAHRRGRMKGGQKSGHSIFMKNEPSERNLEWPHYSAAVTMFNALKIAQAPKRH
jgi:hypothetical protein